MSRTRCKWAIFWCLLNMVVACLYAVNGVTTMAVIHGVGFLLFGFLAWRDR